jgi:hypothetical protein
MRRVVVALTIALCAVIAVEAGATCAGLDQQETTLSSWEVHEFFLEGTQIEATCEFEVSNVTAGTVQYFDGTAWYDISSGGIEDGTKIRFSPDTKGIIVYRAGGCEEEIQTSDDDR